LRKVPLAKASAARAAQLILTRTGDSAQEEAAEQLEGTCDFAQWEAAEKLEGTSDSAQEEAAEQLKGTGDFAQWEAAEKLEGNDDSAQEESAEQLEVINEESFPIKVCKIKLMQDVSTKDLDAEVSVSMAENLIVLETASQSKDLQVGNWKPSTTFCGGWLAAGEGQLWTLDSTMDPFAAPEVIELRTNEAEYSSFGHVAVIFQDLSLNDVVCIFCVSSHFQENHEGNELAYENAKVHSKKAAVQVPEVSTSSGWSPNLNGLNSPSCNGML
jgi:hypothetical protein